jgi:hypothetical protein
LAGFSEMAECLLLDQYLTPKLAFNATHGKQ